MKMSLTKTTVDSALKSLDTIIENLRTAIGHHKSEAQRCEEQAASLITQSNDETRKAEKAERALAKLSDLLS